MSAHDRLCLVERELLRARRDRRLMLILIALLAACLLLTNVPWVNPALAEPPAEPNAAMPPDVVASRIILVDGDGRRVAILSADDGGARLLMRDAQGRNEIVMQVGRVGPQLTMARAESQRLTLGMGNEDHGLLLHEGARSIAGLSAKGNVSRLWFVDDLGPVFFGAKEIRSSAVPIVLRQTEGQGLPDELPRLRLYQRYEFR
jgi:hypothetical protein